LIDFSGEIADQKACQRQVFSFDKFKTRGVQMSRNTTNFIKLFVVIGVWATISGLASAGEEAQIKEINPVPIFYPDGADVPGIVRSAEISDINRRRVVLGDVAYSFSRSAVFLSARLTSTSFSSFKVGTNVGFRLNESGKIAAMWIEDGRVLP
jgi:hypothetical protein